MTYNTADNPDLYKLRFQLNTIRKEDNYSVRATLIDHRGRAFLLNEVYKNIVGGMIDNKT